MNTLGKGLRDALKGAFSSLLLTFIITLFLTLTNNQNNIDLIVGLNALIDIIIIYQFESWGIGYLFGWLVGSFILAKIGLLENNIFELYLFVAFLIIVGYFGNKKRQNKSKSP